MAWLGKVSLGGFSDLAGAVTKLSESVKNIEKNFDSALGLEEKPDAGEASGIWSLSTERRALFDPVMAFMGHKGDESTVGAADKAKQSDHTSSAREHERASSAESSSGREESLENFPSSKEHRRVSDEGSLVSEIQMNMPFNEEKYNSMVKDDANESQILGMTSIDPVEISNFEAKIEPDGLRHGTDISSSYVAIRDSNFSLENIGEEMLDKDKAQPERVVLTSSNGKGKSESDVLSLTSHEIVVSEDISEREYVESEKYDDDKFPQDVDLHKYTSQEEGGPGVAIPDDNFDHEGTKELDSDTSGLNLPEQCSDSSSESLSVRPDFVDKISQSADVDHRESPSSSKERVLDSLDPFLEVHKVKKEMKLMEAALQGAARQAQAKADEIAKLMNENEQLKSIVEDLKRKSNEAEIEAMRDEYRQRVATLERKVYSLTRERDTLKREQSKKSEATALLKEKDEIINQIMAEGEELSKKQANQESTIRKLRAQVRELEEEKQRLNSKIQTEETKVESIKRDKAATEKLLQETIEKNQAELSAQKDFYTIALNAAKEAEALAEARANNEARTTLESRLREADEREAILVQSLEELRQTLSRTEQQAAFREDMLRRDIDDIKTRYQASELRYSELVAQVPESTRPILRQMEAMQEANARRAEAWEGIEKALNSRLQEAEAKAAAAEERERLLNERLSQTLSRMTVLETQITCLRTEQTQLSRSLEKERQRASENRQELLAVKEEAATQEARAKQFEDELRDLRGKFKKELQEEKTHRELLEKELERERKNKADLEKAVPFQATAVVDESPNKLFGPFVDNGTGSFRKFSNASSLSGVEESHFLQASLDSTDVFVERRASGEAGVSSYFLKSMTRSAFEAALRHKDGEIASYSSRLASLESTRDSLAEELVNLTAQCEKLRTEAALLPGIRAELEALRRRHSSALELMGERDEELEELRADIFDLKEMYREQVDMLVDKIQNMSSA